MTKTLLAGVAGVSLLVGTATAQQAGDLYLQGHGGLFFVTQDAINGDGLDELEEQLGFESSVEYDTGFAFGLLGGYRVSPNIAFEAEATVRSNDSENIRTIDGENDLDFDFEADVDTFALMANAVYSAPLRSGITPYAGVGIGWADVWDEDDVDGGFAYQAKAGVSLPAGRAGAFGVEASYFGASEFGDDDLSIEYGGITLLATYRLDLAR